MITYSLKGTQDQHNACME